MGKHGMTEIRKNAHLPVSVWAGGSILLAAALLIRIRAGSPLPVLHLLDTDGKLPPLIFLSLFWFGSFFLFGCGAGYVLSRHQGGAAASWRLRGTVYGLACLPAALGWYPLLFAAQSLWLSWLCLLIACLFCLLCTLCWIRVCRQSGLFLFPVILWLVFLTVLQFILLIRL